MSGSAHSRHSHPSRRVRFAPRADIRPRETDPETALRVTAFRQALAKLGWAEGRNVVIDFRWGAGDPNQTREQAKELTGLTPDVIVLAVWNTTREPRTRPARS